MTYTVRLHPEAEAEFRALDGRQKLLIAKKLRQLETKPLLGKELGNKAGMDLSGYRKLYADGTRIRIVYEVIENAVVVFIVAIGERDEMAVYRSAAKRVN